MTLDNLKILREKIAIPLAVAIQLLKQHNGDIDLCIQEFHQSNILEIVNQTDCDKSIAQTYYQKNQYDIDKAIHEINNLQVIITTRDNPKPKNEIGFILWPEKGNGEYYKTVKRNDAFIPTSDFDYVKNIFANACEEEPFDSCGHNYYNKEAINQIIQNISNLPTMNGTIERFKAELIEWLEDKRNYAYCLVVYGNL